MMKVDVADHGQCKIMKLEGEFFLTSVRQVEDTWNRLVAEAPSVIGIDCKEMSFLDSSAIGTFVKFLHNAMSHNIKLIFFDLNESIIKIFNKAKLNKIFTIMTREEFESVFMKGPHTSL